jgi:tRNA pseudouridine32 synthase/23S rRNA pseudouridine746 synthase
MRKHPATIDGLAASTLQLPPGTWPTVLDCLCARFPSIGRAQWLDRMARGRVLGADGQALTARSPFRVGLEVRYYREVTDEPRIPFEERVLHVDEHLLVVDKPHFLPVTPAGGHVHETLLARLVRRTGNDDLAPLHRIDRETAGLVLFSTQPSSRARYQALFRGRCIAKEYEALAPALPHLEFPHTRASRIIPGEPFFRMQEVAGSPNSETRIDLLARDGTYWRYRLSPVTGRKHQLRVHMAALGAPILNDATYPDLAERIPGDYSTPLQLLAKRLSFVDPFSGAGRSFASALTLGSPASNESGSPVT